MITPPHPTRPAPLSDTPAAPMVHDLEDAIELMFFAYRDFVADPDLLLTTHNFGRAHHRVIHFVGRNPGLSIAELLDILQVTKQSLARILRDLIASAHIRQEIGANDRRKRLLYLTASGHRLHENLIAPQIARFTKMLESINEEEFQIWARVMTQIVSPENRETVNQQLRRGAHDGPHIRLYHDDPAAPDTDHDR